MNESARIAEQIKKMLPGVKHGTLRFWGVWFGRPHDDIHKLMDCDAKDDVLTMRFNQDEVLTVWSPKKLRLDASKFQVRDAKRVRWEWFSYGSLKIEENRFFYDFIKTRMRVVGNTNVNRLQPEMRPSRWLPAVEIL
jgi:hypothetical protein